MASKFRWITIIGSSISGLSRGNNRNRQKVVNRQRDGVFPSQPTNHAEPPRSSLGARRPSRTEHPSYALIINRMRPTRPSNRQALAATDPARVFDAAETHAPPGQYPLPSTP